LSVHNITQLARIGRSVLLKGLDPTTAVEASLARSDDRPSIGAIPSIAAGYVAALCAGHNAHLYAVPLTA